MGLHDRHYWREEQSRRSFTPGGGGGGGQFRMGGFPKPPSALKVLLLANIGAFILQLIFTVAGTPLSDIFGVTVAGWWQVWRYVTFQFLHGGPWHLAINLLVLYFLGTPLERAWGSRRFVKFYLSCGVFAGVAYVIVGAPLDLSGVIIGASGGVYAVLLASAVLFPQIRLLLFFVLPVRIRVLAIVLFGVMIYHTLSRFLTTDNVDRLISTTNIMGDVAHLGGAVAGAFWLWVLPRLGGSGQTVRRKLNQGAWDRKMRRKAAEQADIDRILDKIRDEGIASLSEKEKQRLQDATRRQRRRENDLYDV